MRSHVDRVMTGPLILAALQAYEGRLLRYAERILGDLARAQEVVQDTFLALWQEDPGKVRGHEAEWLFTVCRNRALDVRRKEKRMTPGLQAEAPAVASAGLEAKEDRSAALAALDGLPEEQREVILLKFQGGLSYKEISRVTGLTATNVGYLIHVGLKAVRAELARRKS